jgi:hypothetical protein
MERHIAETEALETRFTYSLLSVAASAPQIGSNQACVVVGIGFNEIRQWGIVSAEEVYDLIADRPWYFRDAFGDECSTSRVAWRKLL